MAATPARATRRRPRRGSLERPVDGRLYRSSFLVVSLPLLILAFSITRPAALPAPLLPPNFDGPSTRDAGRRLCADVSRPPARAAPAHSPRQAGFASRSRRTACRSAGTRGADVPRLGKVQLQNLWAVARGRSPDAIVVMAHRDDTGIGPGANDNASGTAALIELARSYAQTSAAESRGGARIRPAHTLVFLSTDGGAFGGLGADRFAQPPPFHVVATVNLAAIAGNGPPRLVITGDTPRSPAATLVETAAKRVLEQAGTSPATRASSGSSSISRSH